jgi:uncharacterized protein (TIGR00299 family) protein
MDLFFDCFSGISGDMTLGAFADLGVSMDDVKHDLSRIPLSGFDITVENVSKHGIHGKSVTVREDEHVHAMNYSRIIRLIEGAPLSDRVKRLSLSIFDRIAEAESMIHGCPKDKVHFHEVGGIDAMVDIVGTALCVEYLGVENVWCSPVPLGTGFVQCAHGTLPLPAPATAKILAGIPVYGIPLKKELVTPTGAAIIATLARGFGDMPPMTFTQTGYGAGKRDLEDRPNLLRVFAGSFHHSSEDGETVTILETTIDDMNPEYYGYLMECLFADGALDVYFHPVFMKKNRPGTVVTVLCRDTDRGKLTRRILTETTSTGVRYRQSSRVVLPRKAVTIKTPYGEIAAKQIERPDGTVHVTPEYDALRSVAREKGIPIRQVAEHCGHDHGHGPAHDHDHHHGHHHGDHSQD